MNLPSTQSRQRQSGQTVQDAASHTIGDLQGFEDGMGATRNPRSKTEDPWIVPTMVDGAPYQSGDVRIREAGAIGGFRDDQGRRVEIQVKRDGQWVTPTSDDDASAILSAMKRRGSDTQQSSGEQTDNIDVGTSRVDSFAHSSARRFKSIEDVNADMIEEEIGGTEGRRAAMEFDRLRRARSDREALSYANQVMEGR